MTSYFPGDLLLFEELVTTQQREGKTRPMLVLVDTGDDDIIVARMTTSFQSLPYVIEIRHWREAGLAQPSYARLNKIQTVHKSLVLRPLGRLVSADLHTLRVSLRLLFSAWLDPD
jgi:mRNA interferase MazF